MDGEQDRLETGVGPGSLATWLSSLLEKTGVSRGALGRRIERSREEVTRWANDREHIPRAYLTEIAIQLGAPEQIERVMRLKDCEDLFEKLRKDVSEIARRWKVDAAPLEHDLTNKIDHSTMIMQGSPSLWAQNAGAADFAVRSALNSFDPAKSRPIFTIDTIGRHLQYPVNSFLGTVLEATYLYPESGRVLVDTDASFDSLRSLVQQTRVDSAQALLGHHSLHMLARHGRAIDRDLVSELLEERSRHSDPLTRKLGYSGLTLASEDREELAGEYLFYLNREDGLATVDLAFDAAHYGDSNLQDGQLVVRPKSFKKLIANIVRHLEDDDYYSSIKDLDHFRLLRILELDGFRSLEPSLHCRLLAMLNESSTLGDRGREVRRRLEGA